MIGDWAYATAVTVWAYDVGGAKAVGIWGATRYLLMAIFSPVAASLSDRFPRKLVMVGAEVLQMVVTLGAALCIVFDTPVWPVFVLATTCSLLGCVFRPAQMALMPMIASNPEELAASNGASSTIESLAFFIGPALGALLIATFDVPTVFFINVASFGVSSLLIFGIHVPPKADKPAPEEADDDQGPGALAEMLAGFSVIWRDRDLLMVTGLITTQTVIAGASLVFTVVFAIEILDTGAEGVGLVDSAFGVGAIAGGLFAIAATSRNALARHLGLGVVMWSIPLLLVAAWPTPATVIAAVIVMGFGNPLVDVNYSTLTQRLAPDEVLGRVFGAGDGAMIATMAMGAAATPFLISSFGLRSTITGLALVVMIPPVLLFGRCRALDARLVPPEGLALLRAIPMFAPLGLRNLETLAHRLEPVSVSSGEVVVREGDVADRFYVIASGGVDVSHGDTIVRHEIAGDFFGEIGLLHDVPRTATVTATEPTRLLSLGRAEFLDAVSGTEESRVAAHDIASRRIMV